MADWVAVLDERGEHGGPGELDELDRENKVGDEEASQAPWQGL